MSDHERISNIPEDFLRQVEILHHAISVGMLDLVADTIRSYKETHDGEIGALLEYPNEDYFDATALQLAVRHIHPPGCGCKTAFKALSVTNDKKLIAPCNEVIKYSNKKEIVRLLLKNGADVETRDISGFTPTQAACEPRFYFSDPAPEVIPILLEFEKKKRNRRSNNCRKFKCR